MCYFVEEFVGVDCELVYDLSDERLDLHEGIDTSSDLAVDLILQHACYLLNS
jgi:hypothetical protein